MVPSLTRQIRQVREMTAFFLRPKESGGPPSLASSVSSVPKGLAPQGERPERTSLPPHAEAGMPEAAPPDFVTSGQESAEALRNVRRRLFTPAAGTSEGRIAAHRPCARGQRAPTASGASLLLWNFSALSGTATILARAEKRFQRPTACPSAEAPFSPARRKNRRASRRPPRSRVFPASAGRTQRVAHSLAGLPGFRRAGNTNPARWTGGPVSARSRKDARRAWFSVLRACVPA